MLLYPESGSELTETTVLASETRPYVISQGWGFSNARLPGGPGYSSPDTHMVCAPHLYISASGIIFQFSISRIAEPRYPMINLGGSPNDEVARPAMVAIEWAGSGVGGWGPEQTSQMATEIVL